MTQQQAKELWPVIKAWSEGATLQYRSRGILVWADCPSYRVGHEGPYFMMDHDYRIKPEPLYRPWVPEEVPVGCLLKRIEHEVFYTKTLLICVRGNWCHFMQESDAKICEYTTAFMFNNYHHSTDNGKTWQPCGVLE